MKPLLVVTLTGLLFAAWTLTALVDAGRGRRRKQLKQCVYRRKGENGACNLSTGNYEVTYHLKASRQRFDCPPAKIKTKRCPGCKYLKGNVPFGQCMAGIMTKVVPLAAGSTPGCPPTRTMTRRCKKRKGGRRRGGGCVYVNKGWSVCNETTNTRQREKVLVSGPLSCLPKKMLTKKCKKVCRYIKGDWTECDNITNMKNRTMDPKPGSLPQCESKIQTKPCFYGANSKRGKATKCRYKSGRWTPCDPRSNTMTQEMTLRNGDPNLCKRTVNLIRKCRLACKFRRGQWSKCDKMTRLMTRVDTLVKGDRKRCDKQRQITRKCRKAKCKYAVGGWSECSPDKKTRTRIKTLVSVKSGNCQKEIPITKPCFGKDGEAHCFFGSWGDFGPCTNGVMTRQRPLLQGGVECERRAVTTKACGD